MDQSFQDYIKLASQTEDLKSEERVLTTALENLKEVKSLLIEKEKDFCEKDEQSRTHCTSSERDLLISRCQNLVDHLIHYKCLVECLSADMLAMGSELIDDDEFVHMSLVFREAELTVLKAIKTNKKRNELFANMQEEEARSCFPEIESKWRCEHQERRKLINKLILDQDQVIVEKITSNLQEQQILLNQRYQSINNLIRMSY